MKELNVNFIISQEGVVMKIRTRVIGLSLGCSAFLLALMAIGSYLLIKLAGSIGTETQHQQEIQFESLVHNDYQTMKDSVRDLANSDSITHYLEHPTSTLADELATYALNAKELTAGWLFTTDFKIIYSFSTLKTVPSFIENRIETLKAHIKLEQPTHFFWSTNKKIYEIFGTPITERASNKSTSEPQGYFIAIRSWDQSFLTKLTDLSGCSITMLPPHPCLHPNLPLGTRIRFRHANHSSLHTHPNEPFTFPLMNHLNEPVRVLHISRHPSLLDSIEATIHKYIIWFIGVTGLLASVSMCGICTWIIYPLKKITECLNDDTTLPLQRLLQYDEIRKFAETTEAGLQQKKELKFANEIAESANTAKTNFLRNLSHELKTPLNGILGAEQLLEISSPNQLQQEYIEIIKKCGIGLNALIEQLLTLSSIECGRLELKNEPFSPTEVLTTTCNFALEKSDESGIAFSSNATECRLPEFLVGDPSQLKQILIQIVSNAYKFTQTGEINLTASTHENSDQQVTLRVAISDTGIGIHPTRLNELMELFTQGDSSNTRRYEGMGIGLALVRALVEKMGGSISVESTEGQGSCFTVDIPLRKITN